MAMGISNVYGNYTNSVYPEKSNTQKKSEKSNASEPITSEKTNTEKSSLTRKTAMDELSYLSKKFDGYSFAAANYSSGMKYGSSSTTNVAISPQFLSKMANDPELEAEYMKEIENMQELDKQFVAGQAARGWKVVDQGWAIDKDGGISSWAITTKDSNSKSLLQKMSERSNEIREKALEKKRTAADELEYLSKKFDGYSFVAANYSSGMKYGSFSTTNVAISPEFLQKMANDPELEAEYMKEIENMRGLDRQFISEQAAKGWKAERGWVIDKDGGISCWAIGRKDPNAKSLLQKMSDRSNEIREKAAEKKKKQTELEEKAEEIKKSEKAEAVAKEKAAKKLESVVGSTVDLSV